MSGDPFDRYAEQYAKVIAQGARASGESYEYMVELRAGLFRESTARELSGVTAPAILDFGCGTGYTLQRLAQLFPGGSFCGYDSSEESIAVARSRRLPGASFARGESFPLPYPQRSFDAVYSNGTFHHIPPAERGEWLKELRRVLRPAGALVLFENNPLNPLMMQAMRRTPFDLDANPVSARELAALMAAAGFSPDPAHYYFFFPRALRGLRGAEKYLHRVPFGAQYYIRARPA